MPGRRQRLHGVEAPEPERSQRRLGATDHDRVGVAVLDHSHPGADRVRAARARRHQTEHLALEAVLHRDGRRGRIGHLGRDPERGHPRRTAVAEHVVLVLDRLDTADPGGQDAPDPHRVVRELAVPAGIGERLGGCDERELREAVQPSDLLHGQQLARFEVRARAGAVDDSALAGKPALIQRGRADAHRRHGTHAGHDDTALHWCTASIHSCRLRAHSARLTIRSIASPTVLSSFMSSPLSTTP